MNTAWTQEHTEGEETAYGTRQETLWTRDCKHAGARNFRSGVSMRLHHRFAGWPERPDEFQDSARKWPAVALVVELPEGRLDLRSELAERLSNAVDRFIADFDLGK